MRVAHGAHVWISGLTVSGPVPCGFVQGVVAVHSATLELTDARVSDIVPATTTCSIADGRSVQFGLGDRVLIDGERGTTASGRVTGVVVDSFLTMSLVAAAPLGVSPPRVTFADDVVNAGVPQYPTGKLGQICTDFEGLGHFRRKTSTDLKGQRGRAQKKPIHFTSLLLITAAPPRVGKTRF